ncbi:MAG: hypothetical protein JXR58_02615 [Bacteroidales bacterium]|nr:hypothetical protein [Bacteroidales bacterium]
MKTFWLWTIIPFSLFVKSPDFELLSSSVKNWTGGMQGTGGGRNYRIELVVKHSSNKLIFSELLLPENQLEIKIIKNDLVSKEITFSKGDTVIITASERILPDYKKEKALLQYDIKIDEGSAVLVYRKRKKEKFFDIEAFENSKSKNYKK